MSGVELALFALCWFGSGLLGSALVLFGFWYTGKDIDEGDVAFGIAIAILGPMDLAAGVIVALACVCGEFVGYLPKICIKGRKSRDER